MLYPLIAALLPLAHDQVSHARFPHPRQPCHAFARARWQLSPPKYLAILGCHGVALVCMETWV